MCRSKCPFISLVEPLSLILIGAKLVPHKTIFYLQKKKINTKMSTDEKTSTPAENDVLELREIKKLLWSENLKPDVFFRWSQGE